MNKNIKIENLHVANFITFLENCDIKEHPQVLEFRESHMESRATPETKVFLRYSKCNIAGMMKLEKFDGILKFKLYRLNKFIRTMNLFKQAGYTQIDGVIHYDVLGDNNYISHIKLFSQDKKIKIDVKSSDVNVLEIPEHIFNKIADNSNYIFRFQLDSQEVSRLHDISSLTFADSTKAKAVGYFVMAIDKDKVVMKHHKNLWSITYDNNVHLNEGQSPQSFDITKSCMSYMNSALHTIYVMNNQISKGKSLMIVENDDLYTIYDLKDHDMARYE